MIRLTLIGAKETTLRFQRITVDMLEGVRLGVTKACVMLVAYVKEQKLSGQVLKNRTGTLRRKITYDVIQDDVKVIGKVGVDLSYAAVHEYGFDGIVSVRQHLRHMTQAWGKAITPITVTVPAHSRHMKMPERSFLRSSLIENQAAVRDILLNELSAAMDRSPGAA